MSVFRFTKPSQLLACFFILLFQGLQANLTPVKLSIRMDNSVSTVTVGTSTATHSLQLTPPSGSEKDSSVVGIVRLGVDHNTNAYTAPYDAELTIDVETWDALGAGTMHTYTMSVRFQPYGNIAYKAEDIKLFSNQSSKVYKIESTVTAMKINGVTATMFPDNLYLESRLEYVRYGDFSSVSATGNIIPSITAIDLDCNGVNESFNVSWTPVTGAVEYQLEWTFADDYDESGLLSAKSPTAISVDFKNNSTRISTTGYSFVVPIIADRGYFVARVRGIGRDLNALATPIFGEWTPDFEKGTVATYTAAANSAWKQMTTHFEVDKNWQYNVTYAEDAKHKDVISYYDGSLRNRQSITQISTDTTTIVGETMYDFTGRPAITVLPAPLAHHTCSFSPSYNPAYSFNYIPGFNQADSLGHGHPYAKRDFDVVDIGNSCGVTTSSMITTTGASNYYSPSNPEQQNQQAFLPDAQQYPFSQVEYTNDNSGRVRRQGGVGINHQLGTNHETKYFYSVPNQIELDRLFGSEAGVASHYQKNMVMDANGQISITYIDLAGKTVATALAGDPPSNLEALSSQSGANKNLTVDLFNKDAAGHSIINKPNFLPDAIEFNSSIMVTTQSVNTFTYNFTVDTVGDPCLKPNICFHCVYDLEMQVSDECGVQLYPAPGDSLTRVVGSFTTDVGGNLQYITACSGPSTYTFTRATFSLNLSPGVYTVSKTLRVNADARNYYLGQYMSKADNSCFLDTSDFIDAALGGLDTTDCFINCSSCFQALGPKDDFVAQGRGTDLEWESLYAECADLCGKAKTKCEMESDQMLADMAPGGQYGQIRTAGSIPLDPASFPLSVYNSANVLPKNIVPLPVFYGILNVGSNGAYWKNPHAVIAASTYTYYFDDNGQRSKITLAAQPGSTLPGGYNLWVDDVTLVFPDGTGNFYTYPENLHTLEDFIQNWNPNWSKSLVYYHPEYCYYEDCIQYSTKLCSDSISSEDFDRKLMTCQTYNDAVSQQLIVTVGGVNDLNVSMDPFVSCTGTYGTYGTQLASTYANYNNTWGSNLSMGQFAASLAHCGNQYGQSPFTVPHCTEFGYPVPGTPHVQDSINNQQWNTLKSLYLSEKAKQQLNRSDANRLAFGSTCVFYNGCIGNSDFDPFASGMVTFGYTFGLPPFNLNFAGSQYYNSQQPCNIALRNLYKDKQKRFGAISDLKPLDENNAGYQVYVETGLCPNAFNLQNLMSQMAAQHKLAATGEAMVNHSEFVPSLYYYISGTTNPPYYINYDWNATIGTGLDIDFYNVSTATVAKTIHLNDPPARTIDWNKVIGVLQMKVTSTVSGISYFDVTLKHYDNPGDAISLITTSGSTSIILDDCKFADQCTANDFAVDLQALMNALKTTPDNSTSDFSSTTAINLSASPTYSLFLTTALKNVVGGSLILPQYTWKKTAAKVYALYDASSTCSVVITLGAMTPTGLPTSAFTDIASFRNILCNYQNFFTMDGYSSTNTFIESIRANVTKVCGTQTIGISMGTCAPPVPLSCQTEPHETRQDLEILLTDVLQGQKYVPLSSTAISDLIANTDFTDNLKSQITPLPASIVATTYTVSDYTYKKNFRTIHDTTIGSPVVNDSLSIPFNSTNSIFHGSFYPAIEYDLPNTWTIELFVDNVLYSSAAVSTYTDAAAASHTINAVDFNTTVYDHMLASGLAFSVTGDVASDIPPDFVVMMPCNTQSLSIKFKDGSGNEVTSYPYYDDVINPFTFSLPLTQPGVCSSCSMYVKTNNTPSKNRRMQYVVAVKKMVGYGLPSNTGNFNQFYLVADFVDPATGIIHPDTLYGSSCFDIQNCNTCGDTAQNCCGSTPPPEGRMARKGTSVDQAAIAMGRAHQNTDILQYKSYRQSLASLNARLGYLSADKNYIAPAPLSQFYNEGKGVYEGMAAYTRFVDNYDPALDKPELLTNPKLFIKTYGKAMNPVAEYKRYRKALANYNQQALSANTSTLALIDQAVFYKKHMANTSAQLVKKLMAPASKSQSASIQNDLLPGGALYRTEDDIEDTCDVIYDLYLQAYSDYQDYQDSLDDSSCGRVTFYLEEDFIDKGYCCTYNYGDFFNYENMFYNHLVCPDTISQQKECSRTACGKLYSTYVSTINRYNTTDMAVDNSYFLSSTLFANDSIFEALGFCDCAQAYLDYLSDYESYPPDSSLPPPVDINHFAGCGPPKNIDPCANTYSLYVTAVNAYNAYASEHEGFTTIEVTYGPDQFTASGFCYCTGDYFTFLQAVTKGTITDSVYVRENLSIGVYCKPDTLTCLHTHKSDSLFSPPMPPEINPCVKYKRDLAKANALLKYQQYADSVRTAFVTLYNQRCLSAVENYNRNYDESEFHHTLYYYDQAGNLVRTIPPEGIDAAFFNSITSPSSTNEVAVQNDRLHQTHLVMTDHGLATTYLYNSLNQLVRQNLPDHDPMAYTRYAYSWGIDSLLNVVTSQFASANKGYMAGNVAIPSGTNLYFPGLVRGIAYQTTDGGLNWQQVAGTTGAGIRKAQFVTTASSSYTVGFAVGTDGTFMVSYDNGNTWDLVPIHTNALNENLTDLSFNTQSSSDKIDGILVGEHGTSIKVQLNASASPTITNLTGLSTNDSITSITSLPGASNAVDYFISTWNTSTRQASIFTGNNTAIASLTSWVDMSAARANNLTKVNRIPGTAKYFAGGEDGLLLKFDNATSKWNKILTGTKADFKDLYFIDENNGIAILKDLPNNIHGDLYKTTNGGLTWILLDGGNTSTDEYLSLNAYIKASVSGSFSTDKLVACGTAGLVKRVTIIKNTVSNTCQFGAVNMSISTSNAINGAMVLPYNSSTQYYVLAGGNSGSLYANADFSQSTITWNAITVPGLNTKRILFDIKSPNTIGSSTKINGVIIETDGTLSRIVSSSLTATPVTYTVGPILQGTGSYTFTDMSTLESPVTPGSISNVYMLGDDGTNSKVAYLDLSTALISTSAPTDITSGQISSVTGLKSLAMRTNDDAVTVGAAGEIYSNKGNTLPGSFGTWTNESATVLLSKVNDLSISGVSGSADLIMAGDQGLFAQRTLSGTYAQIKNTHVINHLNAVQNYTLSGSNSSGALAGTAGFVATYTSTASNNSLLSSAITNPVTGTFNDVLVNLPSNLAFAVGDNGKAISISSFSTAPVANAINTNTTKNLRGLSLMPGTTNMLALGDQMQNFILSAAMAMKHKAWFVNEITKLHFTNTLNGYLVGKQGLIRHTADGGNTWLVAKPFYTVSNKVTNYYSVYTKANDQAFIGGDNRYFAAINNVTLSAFITYSLSAPQVIRDMDMNASGIGIAVGTNTTNSKAFVLKTPDAGITWTTIATPTTVPGARAVNVFNDGSFIAVGINKCVFRYNAALGTLTLVTQPTPGASTLTLNDVYFHDDENGYIAADNGYVFSTADFSNGSATATWNTVPINDDWLSSGNAPNVNLKTISFYSRYDGFMGGDYSATYKHARNFHDESNQFSTFFWYDKLGRLVVSQNTRQKHKTPVAYSYARYDALGGITEVGEKADTAKTFESIFGTYINTVYNAHAIDDTKLTAWIMGNGSRTEVTKTYYDNQTILNTSVLVQQNLRKRVATSTYENYDDKIDSTYNSATHYSYDIHGNVNILLQENRALVYVDSVPAANPTITLHKRLPFSTYADQRYKRIDYDYDLVGGKVNLASYQAGKADAFYHQYIYDADNRIVLVKTSRNALLWENDANYVYYKHGPLARVEMGHDKVQGMDYAYTIEGWIKGVNSNLLKPDNDMGQDGASAGVNHLLGQDAMGYSSRYFSGDYSAVNSSWATVSGRFEADPTAPLLALRNDLYNGNISLMGTTIVDASAYSGISSSFTMTPKPMAGAYTYDQLNRLVNVRASENLSASTNTWSTSGISSNLYANSFIYDANGNINNQVKYDETGTPMDDIDYYYNTSGTSGGRLKQNRLYGIGENVSTTTYSLDIETPGFSAFNYSVSTINTANNYGYDELGNLTRDGYEEIDLVKWSMYGKIKELDRTTGSSKNNLKFDYDASGNRIAKHNYDNSGAWLNSTYYVRDAQGNVMGTYFNEPIAGPSVSYRATERPLYGSSRLGLDRNEVEMIANNGLNRDSAQRVLGNKQYELSNHLGNVLAVISDKKIPIDSDNDNDLDFYIPEVMTATDYYAFGQPMPARNNQRSYTVAPNVDVVADATSTGGWGGFHSSLSTTTISGDPYVQVTQTVAGYFEGSHSANFEAGVTYTVSFKLDIGSCSSGDPVGLNLSDGMGSLSMTSYSASGTYSIVITSRATGGILNFHSLGTTCTDFYIGTISASFSTAGKGGYRYAFNGKEKDDETYGEGNEYDYGMRMYDPRLGRFMSVDPLAKKYPELTSYQFASNSPIANIDLDGLEKYYTADNKYIGQIGDNSQIRIVKSENVKTVEFWVKFAASPPPKADDGFVSRAAARANQFSTPGTAVIGTGESLIYKPAETGKGGKVAGYEVKGEIQNTYAGIGGEINGFVGEAKNESGTGSYPMAIVASAKVAGVEASVSGRLGTENNNVSATASGAALSAEASVTTGVLTGEGGKKGLYFGANAGASVLKGEVVPSISIFGFKIGITIGGSIGSAHIGAGLGGYYDSKSGTTTVKGQVNAGLGAGLKIGFEIEH